MTGLVMVRVDGVPSPGGELTGATQTGDSGLVLGCGLVQRDKSGVRNPLGSRARVRDGRSRVNGGGGGSAWQSITGDGVLEMPQRLRLTDSSAQKVQGEVAVLTGV